MVKSVFLSEISEIKFCIVNSSKQTAAHSKWIMPANLMNDNILTGYSESDKYKPDDTLLIYKNDIIIKRINPSFVNYIDTNMENIFACNNLIIVRAKKVNPKYLSSYLNRKIKEFSENHSIGAIMPSIGRQEIENFQIPLLSVKEQEFIGDIWYKSIEKKKMLARLAKLENEKEIYLLNKFINKKMGGSKQ